MRPSALLAASVVALAVSPLADTTIAPVVRAEGPVPPSARTCSPPPVESIEDPAPAIAVAATCSITATSPGTIYATASASARGYGAATSTIGGVIDVDNAALVPGRVIEVNSITDELTGQMLFVQGGRHVTAGNHTVHFSYELIAGPGPLRLQWVELNAIFVPDVSTDMLGCRDATDLAGVRTTTSTTFAMFASCTVNAPGPGLLLIVGSAWVLAQDGMKNEGYFQVGLDGARDEVSTRWVNIDPTTGVIDRVVAVQSATHVAAGAHTAQFYAGRAAGPGTTSFGRPDLHAYFVPDGNPNVTACAAAPVDLNAPTSTFVKSVECTLSSPRTTRVLTLSTGSISTGAGGARFRGEFALGINGQIGAGPRRILGAFNDALDGFDSTMAIESSARLPAGTYALQLYAKDTFLNGPVKIYNPQLFAIAFIEPPDFVPLVPSRVLETRQPQTGYVGGKPLAGQTLEVAMAGPPPGQTTGDVPADAKAVAFNLTGTEAAAAGYVTGWPCGVPPPTASNLNLVAGGTSPNAVVSQVGQLGRVCLFTQNGAHLVADVNGYMPSWSHYVATVPDRILETRVDGRVGYVGGKPEAGQVIDLDVTRVSTSDVPDDAIAVVLNITGVEATADGYVTIWPCGTPRPTASNLNLAVGATAPNLVIVKIGDGGKVCIYTQSGAHIVADVNGYLPSLANYQPLVPVRLLETRTEGQVGYTGPKPAAGAIVELQVTGPLVPSSASAAVLNLTGTEPSADGFVTVWPCGTPRPTASNLNLSSGATSPNLVIVKIGNGGKVCIFTQNAAHLIADLNGCWT